MGIHPAVCIFTETYYPVIGGGEIQAQNLATQLAANGSSVIVLTRRSDSRFSKVENFGGVTVYRFPPTGNEHFKKWGLLFTGLLALVKYRCQYDLIIVSGFRVIGISAILIGKLLGKPCILKADSLGEMSGEFFRDGLVNSGFDRFWFLFKIYLSFRNMILRMANAFIAISTDIDSELLEHGVPAGVIHRIPNSVNIDKFRPVSSSTKLNLRQKLGVPREETVAIFTGRLVSYKGLPLLLRVWKELSYKHERIRLLLVGSGGLDIHNCEKELREFVTRNGLQNSVSFVGEIHDVHEYLQASDIFVFPTENEAFGIAFIEAMSCALPVISTPVGGARDILKHEKNGLLVKAGHPQELYDALDRLIGNATFSAYIGQNAWRTVQDGYTSEIIIQQYIQLIGHLVATSPETPV